MNNTQDIEQIIEELSSKQKLERDKNIAKLISSLPNYDTTFLECLLSSFISVIKKPDEAWETYHGILQAIISLISQNNINIDDHHLKEIRDASSNLLTFPEVRVRQTAGEVLGSLCTKDSCFTYIHLKSKLLQLIESNLERQSLDSESSFESEVYNPEKIVDKLNSSEQKVRRNSGSSSQAFHDTAGWRNLETSMKCLEYIIKGCGDKFIPFIDGELLELLFTTLQHANRFVRETGFTVCAALVSCGMSEGDDPAHGNPMIIYGDQLSEQLSLGLADNWSQVRLAASVATRKFLMTLPFAARERFFPILLPRICLNRYYLAEGVRLFSQETWRQVTGCEGRHLVEVNIQHVVSYYIEATEADNHAVREAACECIAELALKIPTAAVKPYVLSLLQALKICFNDDSWPVRDAACLACGNFIFCFPDESADEIDSLFPLFFNNLQDIIPSVRQGAAAALLNVVKTYKELAFPRVQEWIYEGLKGVENQASECKKYGELDTGPAIYGVVKQKRDNDMELHSNKQMYSCGSLAPKMGRGGCTDCRFRRPTQEWEKADGCIYLIGELSNLAQYGEEVAKMLPSMATACSLRHYTLHFSLLETLCKTLPIIAKGLGKRLIKPKLHIFFDSIFYSLESENALCSSAASQCLNHLSQFLGPNILRGRVEEFNPSYVKALDANSYIAPL